MVDLEKNIKSISVEPTLLRISDKLSLRYAKWGQGPPLVLLHTIRTQLEYFRALAPLLAEKFTVYAVDLLGHGHSPIDRSAPYDEPYMRKGVVGFLEALDLRDVTIVGESIGAVLALTVAADVPDRIRAVYALNTYDYETRYGDGIRRGNWFANLILLAEFDLTGRRPQYRFVERKVLSGWRSWSNARELYPAVQALVTLIYGDKDWSRPAERERTRAALKNARMVTLPNTGHFSAVENPHGVASFILS